MGPWGEHNYYPWKCLELKYEECFLRKLSVVVCDRSGFTDSTELTRNSKDTLLLQLMFICGSSEILQLFIQRGLPCSPFGNVYSGFCQLGLSLHTILLSPHWWSQRSYHWSMLFHALLLVTVSFAVWVLFSAA